MNAEILAVGTELLMGQISNTNAQYISALLPEAGVFVYRHSVIGDNPKRLEEAIRTGLSRADIVIATGGLGPTEDDLTKEVASAIMGRKLIVDEQTVKELDAYFQKVCRPMTKNNLKQALMPEGSIVIRNSNGTAPGFIIEKGDKIIVLLPGPPREMRPMFKDFVLPYLKAKSSTKLVSKYIKIFGVGESAVEERIIDIIDAQTNPTIAPYAKEGVVTLRVTVECNMDEDPGQKFDPVISAISERLGDCVFSIENEEMEQVVAEGLLKGNITISIAESCTGGLISEKLTAIPGISRVFLGGVVAYSNDLKMKLLGVKPETLYEYGAVSSQTAAKMAEGIRKCSRSDIGLSVTGIAGPDGGSTEKPVGLVYIGYADSKGTCTKELRLWGDRERIRNVSSLHALNMVRIKAFNKKCDG
ncbi:MAG: competence/damage-inducible protein A [Eubacteriales bacterium]|nr:competence/damage-inducible protein A [Eubacteriales bacterium]